MSDIFISYSSEDKNRVKSLAQALEKKGWSVWWDRRIPAGKSFDEVIHEALRAARSVVVVWTKTSVKSTWVKNESRSGLRRGILFPVMLLDKIEIPLEFEHLQAAHLMDWEPGQDHPGFDQFIEDLAVVIGTPMTTAVQPSPLIQPQEPPPLPAKPTPNPEIEPLQGMVRAVLGGNNNLSALTVSPGSLAPAFTAGTENYTVIVASTVASMTITPRLQDTNATMTLNGQATNSGQARTTTLSGAGLNTLINIVVTAPNGTQKTYTVNAIRAALGRNNNLQSLTVSPGSLTPAFTAARTSYTVNVGSGINTVNATATPQDIGASITMNGQGTSSGQARTISLGAPGSNTEIEVIVIAPNGSTKTYLVTVNRSVLALVNEVEPEPEGLKQKTTSQESPGESTRAASSTDPLHIGIGLLALGALVYFVIVPGPYPEKTDEPLSRPSVESPSAKPDVITPTPVPGPIKQPPTVTVKEKPAAKPEATAAGTMATKPQPVASPAKTIIGKDGAPMVLIPVGSFLMGSTDDEVDRAIQFCVKELEKDQQTCEGWHKSELPQHKVRMDAFYLDKYEVTNRLFQQFVQQTGHRTTAEQEGSAMAFIEGKGWENVKGASWRKPETGATVFDSGRAEHPAVSVSWDDAQAYCRWAGKRLSTEAEFEYAMRAGTTTTYWWGQGNPGSRRVENIADEAAKNLLRPIMSGYDDGAVRTAPVGSYEANPWGLYDISGNVREWTADWYDEHYYSKSPERNPKGPSSDQYRVVRGGSWSDAPAIVRSANRLWYTPTNRGGDIGFRCVQDVN